MGLCGLINTMVLTRLLLPEAYVMHGLMHNFSTSVIMFLCFGLDTAYSRFYYDHCYTQKKFLVKVILLPACLFLLFALVLVEPRQWIIHQIFGADLSALAVGLLLLYLLFSLLHRFTQLTARMEERAINYVSSSFIGKFGFVSVVFIIYLLTQRKVDFNWVLISSTIAVSLATLLNLWILFSLRSEYNGNGTAFKNRDFLAYGLPHMVNSVLLSVIPLVEKIVIRNAADEGKGIIILGIYTAAAAFQTVVFIVTQTINNIWNPLVFKHCADEKKFKPIMHNFGQVVTLVTVSGFAVCVLLRRWLVLILDKEYYDAYIIAPAVCFGACYSLVAVIYGSGINIVKKTIHHIVEPLIQIVISVVLCYLLIPTFELVGAGIAVVVSIVISRTYKNVVGLHFYSTGVTERKTWVLMGICTVVALASLFLTSLMADVIMFTILIVSMLLILNKDLLTIIQTAKTLLVPKKVVKKEVQE